MTQARSEKQRALTQWCIEQSIERGALVVEHRCDDCGKKETFERKQFRERGWRRAWRAAWQGVQQQIELCPECRSQRAAKHPRRVDVGGDVVGRSSQRA